MIGESAERDEADDDADGGPGKQTSQVRPLHVLSIRKHRDEIAEDQQRQHDPGRLFRTRKDHRKRRDEQDPEARDAGLGDSDHERAHGRDQPLPGADTQAFV